MADAHSEVPGPRREHQKRNAAIVAARAAGRTYVEIGAEFGVCYETVRQIVTKAASEAKRRAVYETWSGPTDDIPIRNLPLSSRARNALAFEGCNTVGDALRRTDAELMRVPNLGHKTLAEIRALLGAQDRGE
jgi:DNA-directed RNA polymerase alpha subunit